MMRALISAGVCLLLVAAATDGRAESTASPPEATGVVLVAAPIGPTEQALVEALITRLRAEGLAVTEPVRRADPGAATPRGQLTVRFDRARRKTAVWLEWRGPKGGHGWAVRHDVLDDVDVAVEQLVEALQIDTAAGGERRGDTDRRLRVQRYDLWSTRYAVAYNGAGLVVDMHQFEGEVRWPRFAVGVGYGFSSYSGDDALDLDEDDRYFGAREGSAHSLRADIRWYGQTESDWYLYAAGRFTTGSAVMLTGLGEEEVDRNLWMNILGAGGYWGDVFGPFVSTRIGLPIYTVGAEAIYTLTTPQTLMTGLDLEAAIGWRF